MTGDAVSQQEEVKNDELRAEAMQSEEQKHDDAQPMKEAEQGFAAQVIAEFGLNSSADTLPNGSPGVNPPLSVPAPIEQMFISEPAPRPERVKRPLNRDQARQLEVLKRRRDQTLAQADELAKLDEGINSDEVRAIRSWLEQDYACLISVLEQMPKPAK